MMRNPLKLALVACLPLLVRGQSLQDFEKRVTEFTLKNGMHFIVLERHESPTIAFHSYVNAGSVDDPGGKTGLAHMFEHMIGKGTISVGTKNWPLEEKALQAVEEAYDRLDNEKWKGLRADPAKVKTLEAALKAAIDKANGFVESNAYPRVIEENGGSGFNAGTSTDSTVYFYSLPSNRAELWFLLTSEWFKRPVFREFYKERDVVREERRMRVESSPQGKVMEMMLATAFTAFPYRTTVGWGSDIENLRAKDALAFFQDHYAPGNITYSMAGDITPAQARALAEKYFGPIPARPMPEPVITVEPVQDGEKRVAVQTPAQPFVMLGYKRPDQRDKDDPVFDVISGILASGRTGVLYKELVRDKKISLAAGGVASFPGSKYPHAFLFYSVPAVGHTNEENEKAIYDVIEKLKKEKVDAETLDRVKTKVRAGLIHQLDSNSGLASQLASYHVNYGSWKVMFTGIEDINKVTADDVQRVAQKYFVDSHRTVAFTVKGEEQKGDEQ